MCSINTIVMPGLVEAEQHREDLLDLGRRQPGHRLVGKQQPRRARHRAGEFELAHLDLGQVARQPARFVGKADIVKELEAALLDRGVRRRAPDRALTV